jgi:hypothetical protein
VQLPPSCTSLSTPRLHVCSPTLVHFITLCSTIGLDYSGIQPQKQVTSTPNPLAAAAAAAGATPGPGRLAGATPGTAMAGGTPGRAIAGVASTPGGLAAALGATPGELWVCGDDSTGACIEHPSATNTWPENTLKLVHSCTSEAALPVFPPACHHALWRLDPKNYPTHPIRRAPAHA